MAVGAEPRSSSMQPAFWVEVTKPPPLNARTNVYRTIDNVEPDELKGSSSSDEDISSDEEDPSDLDTLELQEIVGQHTWPGGKTYLYARLRSEVIRKFRVAFMEQHFPELVDEYKDMRKNGQLEPFDPNSVEVAREDRPPHIAGPRKHLRRSMRTRRSISTKSPGESDFENTDNDEDEGPSDETDTDGSPPARVTRATRHPLLSPRKTRRRIPSRRAPPQENGGSDFIMSDSSNSGSDSESDKKPKRGPVPAHRRVRKGPRIYHEYGSVVSFDDFVTESYGADGPLYAHVDICSKCHTPPTHLERKKKGKRRKLGEFEIGDDELAKSKGGWVACVSCCQAIHFGCLSKQARGQMIRRIRQSENAKNAENSDSSMVDSKRHILHPLEVSRYLCNACANPGPCLGCKEAIPSSQSRDAKDQEDPFVVTNPSTSSPNPGGSTISQSLNTPLAESNVAARPPPPLLFRCVTCLRPAHYEHLAPLQADEDTRMPPARLALEYQEFHWQCKDCHSWTSNVDKILAWRPYPADAKEPEYAPGEVPPIKDALPREYLVKWEDRSYGRVDWVPHLFLVARFRSRLSNFLRKGPSINLLDYTSHEVQQRVAERSAATGVPVSPIRVAHHTVLDDDDDDEDAIEDVIRTPTADPDADLRIPSAWRLVDRILYVYFWNPGRAQKQQRLFAQQRARRVVSTSSEEDSDDEDRQKRAQLQDGVKPDDSLLETWIERRGRKHITEEDADDVVWAYMKWQDLPYETATWDTPPTDPEGRESFRTAFVKFILGREVSVPSLSLQLLKKRDDRPKKTFKMMAQPGWQPSHLKLKPFQLEGVTWLYENWWNHQHCILADEMGLGKTVQVATFIGKLVKEGLKVFPILIVVPNSTITNWVRELELWAPGVRVVMYAGVAKARDIIRDYEMKATFGGIAFHVLLATYETLTSSRDFGPIFKSVSRWEVTIVDEGQRLKSDRSLLFKRLNELTSIHRILMTGTPINNNIREIFNLMNYLDPQNWSDLDALERKYTDLTEDLVRELHEQLRPYFLRRVKAEVMKDLPRKHEVIVPINMTSLQAEVAKSILNNNSNVLAILAQNAAKVQSSSAPNKVNVKKTNMNNALMQIRKCMQHPYLVDPNLEPPTTSRHEAHKQLVDASAKLRFLQMMLPKLKARRHRVLLFSQFAIALNVIEDFLVGEGLKFLRLDGSTPQRQRQKDMDAFNSPNSEYFIYILSTRAGGVGINLWSADVVIIHDVDFNPHNDLQAIARAHRMGQTKPVLVFTLMIKSSAEEKIVEVGKKKLVLDHVIVQKMDDEEASSDQLQSILSFGAKALFEENSNINTTYSSEDIDNLIDRVQQQTEKPATEEPQGSITFGFAKIWERQQGQGEAGLNDFEAKSDAIEENADFWAKILEQSKRDEEAKAARMESGRGVRRKATKTTYAEEPIKPIWKGKKKAPDDNDYDAVADESSPDEQQMLPEGMDAHTVPYVDVTPQGQKRPLPNYLPNNAYDARGYLSYSGLDDSVCGICGNPHVPGQCELIRLPSVIAEARRAILDPDNREPPEYRAAALVALDQAEQTSRPNKRRKATEGRDTVDSAGGRPRVPSTPSNVRPVPINSHSTAPAPSVHEAGPTYQTVWRVNSSPYQVRDLPSGSAPAPIQSHQNRFDTRPSLSLIAAGQSVPQPPYRIDGTTANPSSTNLGPVAVPRNSLTSANPIVEAGKRKPFPAPQVPQALVPAPITRRPFPLDFESARLSHALKPQGSSMPGVQSITSVGFNGASLSNQASPQGSRTCLLCREGVHDLAKCPKMVQPDLQFLRGTLARLMENRGNNNTEEKMFIDRLSKSIQRLEARESARPAPIVIDSD